MRKMPGRLPHATGKQIDLFWNGKSVQGLEGDSLAAALYGAGIRTFTKSRKFHHHRGLSGTFTAGHLASVDGLPHCRLDKTPARDGLRLGMENVWPSAGFDLLALSQHLPRRMIRAGFEHPRVIPDGSAAWKLWEKLLWNVAGESSPPSRPDNGAVPGQRIEVDTLIVGGGPAGLAAARQASGSVLLVSRSRDLGGMAFGMDAATPDLPDTVSVLTEHEVYALFDDARIAMIAPNNPAKPAILVEAKSVVLATGVHSVPPLVPGAATPGVLDARMALHLAARYGVSPGNQIVVAGTPSGRAIADRLGELGCSVVDFIDVSCVQRILGNRRVSAVLANGKRIACDAVVHAGPWRTDPTLPFQAGADGDLRLFADASPAHVTQTGLCAEPVEDISFGHALDRNALVCPCMDVTVDEVIDLVRSGISHIEELKRRTTCGMGTCQGVPCWDNLAAVVADVSGRSLQDIGHPSYRPPRAALTFGQAAGLADMTEVEP